MTPVQCHQHNNRCFLGDDQMTLTLHLPPDLEQRLTQEAQRQGCSLDDYTLELLNKSLPPQDHRTELVTLLQNGLRRRTPKNNVRPESI